MEIPNQKKVWDKIAEPWKNVRKVPYPHVEKFLKSSEIKGNLLDLGCGSGRNFIKKSGLDTYGVDFSKNILKFAQEYADKNKISVNLKQSSADKLDFEDNFFDCAIYIATLHCISSETARKRSIQELHRVIKPKGKVMISVWSRNQERVKNKPKESLIPWSFGVVDEKTPDKQLRYYYLYDQKEFQDLLESVGFKVLSLKEDKNIIAVVEK